MQIFESSTEALTSRKKSLFIFQNAFKLSQQATKLKMKAICEDIISVREEQYALISRENGLVHFRRTTRPS